MYRLIIEHIIRSLLQEEEFTNLNVKSFVDHKDRTNKFVDYLSSSTPITFKGGEPKKIITVRIKRKGETEPIDYDPIAQANELKAILPKLEVGDKLYLVDDQKKAHSITTVSKTTELGGKGKGGSLKVERRVIANLQAQFEAIGTPITLSIAGQDFEGVDGVVNVKENQKADFAFTVNKQPAIFISYKPGSSPRDIILYGGLTKSVQSSEVQAFIEAVQAQTKSMKENRIEYGAPVKDQEVAQKAVFGSNFGSDFGDNNVQFLVQGDNLELAGSDESYTLKASHIITSGELSVEGGYEPFYNARYANDRNQFGIQNCRFGIIPAGARKATPLSLS
jgi:hypothetical protein